MPTAMTSRADRFIARVHGERGNVLAFSSGHIIRMIAARWHGLARSAGRMFYRCPANIGVLGFEHDSREQPILRMWNNSTDPAE